MICALLTPDQFHQHWPFIEKELENVRHTWEIWWTKEALREAVMNGYVQAWAIGSPSAVHLVAFTNIVHYPANTILKVALLVGNSLDKYFDIMEATFEKYAMDHGCTYMETHGRDGWRRRIKDVKHHGVLLTRKIGSQRVQ